MADHSPSAPSIAPAQSSLRPHPTVSRARRTLVVSVVVAAVLGTACEKPGVRWTDEAPLSTTQPSPLAQPPAPYDSTIADSSALSAFMLTQDLLREAGAHELVASHLDSTAAARETFESPAAMPMMAMDPAPDGSLGEGDAPADSARCARSLRATTAPGRGRVAAWWSLRPGGRTWLLAAWREGTGETGAWRGPIVVDSLDQGPGDAQASSRGAVGCARTAPSIVVDDKHGYVHIAYALTGPEGPGVFYAHQMHPRSAFEPPRVIVYGDKLGAARVAAEGDVVAIAYEDPNSGSRPRIGLAVSKTSGHVFVERLTASADNANARDPFVAVRGRAVIVGWSDLPPNGDTTFRVRRARIE